MYLNWNLWILHILNEISNIFSQFLKEENKDQRYSSSMFQGYTYWPYIRMYLLNSIYTSHGLFNYEEVSAHTLSIRRNMRILWRSLVSLKNLRSVDNLFFLPNRNDSEKYYTDLTQKYSDHLTISTQATGEKFQKDIVYYDVIKYSARIIGKILGFADRKIRRTNNIIQSTRLINEQMSDIRDKYFEGILLQYFYSALIKSIVPQRIFLMPWYLHYPAVVASKKYIIPCYDIQHGVIHDNHYGYNFNSSTSFPLPKKFLLLGDYWKKFIRVGQNVEYEIIGNTILASLGNPISVTQKSENIIVISQYSIRHKIAAELSYYLPLLAGQNLFVKLHPKENNTKAYDQLKVSAQKYNINVELLDGETSIYSIFEKCTKQIGVSSTAIYEGLSFGMTTLLLQCPGWKNMKNMVNNVDTFLADGSEAVIEFIGTDGCKKSIVYFEYSRLHEIKLQ